ncbi:TIGR00341 family protein [Leptotrichia sp. oral taxon 417]|jgi:TIGR00341 family protein|uniref:TIGR00341 family protein n=1 Tax=Leptotrichia sp. oral taxon 417 TaxID=712365 RepID=UPI0015BE7995|nr:TIGR00341 family protein [Leptotrichia sp. oral taxon 417]NWO26785.1 TIGR00341 family protein [Leptotrichia sp. oral taxon 417]
MIEKIKHEKYKILKRNIIEDSDFTKETMFILICAMIIASIGLNTNSVAVIIGAMLISPLMSPIQSIGLGLSNGNLKRVYTSLFRLGIFILISVISSTFYFLVSPINEATPQILARTSPTLWDVLIAIFGGIAGVIGKTEEDGGNVVPGVAIATALMPPLCVIGFGIAHGNLKIFLGAGYLFIINVFFIMMATLVGLIIYSGNIFEAGHKISIKKQIIFYIGSLIVIVPSIYTAATLVQDTATENSLKKFISKELNNHYVFDNSVNKKDKTVTLKIVGEAFKKQDIEKLEKKLEKYKLKNYKLKIQQLSNEKYLTAQDLSKYLNEEKTKENTESVALPSKNEDQAILESDLKTVENVLYKNFSNSISGVKIGKLIDTNNNENFVVLVIGNETMTDEISEKIKNLEFNTEKKYEIIIEKNKQEKVNAISKENQK